MAVADFDIPGNGASSLASDREAAVLVAPRRRVSALTDWIGVVASIGCAIHCAAMPIAIAFLPAIGFTFLTGPGFHQGAAVVCSLIAAAAFVPGWRRHRRFLPVGFALLGLGLINAAAFAFEGECCSTCSAPPQLNSTHVQQEAETCDRGCCGPRQKLDPVEAAGEPQLALASPFASAIPFVTPLGALILVTAHLANRRYSCLCCPCQAGASTESGMPA